MSSKPRRHCVKSNVGIRVEAECIVVAVLCLVGRVRREAAFKGTSFSYHLNSRREEGHCLCRPNLLDCWDKQSTWYYQVQYLLLKDGWESDDSVGQTVLLQSGQKMHGKSKEKASKEAKSDQETTSSFISSLVCQKTIKECLEARDG